MVEAFMNVTGFFFPRDIPGFVVDDRLKVIYWELRLVDHRLVLYTYYKVEC